MAAGRSRHVAVSIVVFLAVTVLPRSPVAQTAVATTPSGFWTSAGTLPAVVGGYTTATLLASGKVLVAGGQPEHGISTPAVDLYDPQGGTWSLSGPLLQALSGHTATLIDTDVLLPGGSSVTGITANVEIYDSRDAFTQPPSMHTSRTMHTATLLPTGKILVAGGYSPGGVPLNSAELFDPKTILWSPTGAMHVARAEQIATLLPNGEVLVAGGYTGPCPPCTSVAAAELYNPISGTWTATGAMNTHRARQRATLLPSGQVLVEGGCSGAITSGGCTAPTASAELYNPGSGAWTPTGSMSTARAAHTATLLPSGQVLVAGGDVCTTSCTSLNSAELYDPATGTWSPTAGLRTARDFATATLLNTGQVLVAGGWTINHNSPASTTELYTTQPVSNTAALPTAPSPRPSP